MKNLRFLYPSANHPYIYGRRWAREWSEKPSFAKAGVFLAWPGTYREPEPENETRK